MERLSIIHTVFCVKKFVELNSIFATRKYFCPHFRKDYVTLILLLERANARSNSTNVGDEKPSSILRSISNTLNGERVRIMMTITSTRSLRNRKFVTVQHAKIVLKSSAQRSK